MNPHVGPHGQIAGQLLPLAPAEDLLRTLESVVSARIDADQSGGIEAIHVLVTGELKPKNVVRNIESALAAHFGLRVDHRKVSVATTVKRPQVVAAVEAGGSEEGVEGEAVRGAGRGRSLYFEDIEIRGSRLKGMVCRVTLRHRDRQCVGEAEGADGGRARVELAARAALAAVGMSDANGRQFVLEGVKVVQAFEHEVVLVGVVVRQGRHGTFLVGSCAVRESEEAAGVMAVLDATNRWVEGGALAVPA